MQNAVSFSFQGQEIRGMQHLPESTRGIALIYHGFTGNKLGSHRMFLKMSRLLASLGFATYRFDFLGSGESDGEFHDMTISSEIAQGEHMLHYAVSQHAPGIPVLLIGHSLGGVVASIVAKKCQSYCSHLALLCPGGMIREAFAAVDRSLYYIPKLDVYDYHGDCLGNAFFEDIEQLQTYEAAKGFNGNILILHGTKDEAVPVEVSLHYQRYCYGNAAQLVLVEGADHSFNGYYWEEEILRNIAHFARSIESL
ncbi:MAG: alpha/beta hydrolase [Bacilli bacterium]